MQTIPKSFVPVPGVAVGSTFKSVRFETITRHFWVSNRYLRYDGERYYMPATHRLNKGYPVTKANKSRTRTRTYENCY